MRVWPCLVLAGCALTSKSAPLELRYFSPETAQPAPAAVAPIAAPHARLRVGRISASADLRYPIVHRESPVEIAPYETLRWTDTPDTYVRRALGHALFDTRPLDQALGGDAPTLDVDVTAFEEIQHGARHGGRVELRYLVHDDREVLARGTIAIERDAAGATIEPVVASIGSALDAATAQLADRVVVALCPH
jgi:ABC-type uncharacterized transport system auxiliary subunit